MANSAIFWRNKIGDFYISLPEVQYRYGLTESDIAQGFDALFSKVIIERFLFYAVGYCIYVFELIIDAFKAEIQNKVDGAYICNEAWFHAQALKFQKGDALVLNKKTFVYEYENVNVEKQIIKRVAVREVNGGVKYFVATEGEAIEALSASDLALFTLYSNQIKPTGVTVTCVSQAGDEVAFELTVNYNPLLIDNTGKLISGDAYPVNDAINDFIDNLNNTNFGGKLNLTKLIDKVQEATGVVDARITSCVIRNLEPVIWGTFDSLSGWFVVTDINVSYQPQNEL